MTALSYSSLNTLKTLFKSTHKRLISLHNTQTPDRGCIPRRFGLTMKFADIL